MDVQESTAYLSQYIPASAVQGLEGDYSFTGVSNGRIIGFAGLIEFWPGRAEVWAEFSSSITKNEFVSVHRAALRLLDVCPYIRVEAVVDREFKAANRWAVMLGFKVEADRLEAYSPDGRDCRLYARVKS